MTSHWIIGIFRFLSIALINFFAVAAQKLFSGNFHILLIVGLVLAILLTAVLILYFIGEDNSQKVYFKCISSFVFSIINIVIMVVSYFRYLYTYSFYISLVIAAMLLIKSVSLYLNTKKNVNVKYVFSISFLVASLLIFVEMVTHFILKRSMGEQNTFVAEPLGIVYYIIVSISLTSISFFKPEDNIVDNIILFVTSLTCLIIGILFFANVFTFTILEMMEFELALPVVIAILCYSGFKLFKAIKSKESKKETN